MNYIVSSLLQTVMDAVTSGMDLIGNSVINLLTLDIGSGSSFFEIVFKAIGDFYPLFIAMALTILAINYFWQLVRMMFFAEGTGDTPLSLTGRTLVAGIFVYLGRDLIYFIQQIFSVFYDFLLNVKIDGVNMALTTNFTELGANLQTAVSGAASGAEASIGGKCIVLIFTVILAVQFFSYMLEVVERYVLLGVLYFTAPLAFSMAGSKSTANVFASWVRMVGSQMFLMVCNVLFLRLFLTGFVRYDDTINYLISSEAYTGVSSLSLCLVWCFVLHGILYVGTRIDSYLGTLGLSAAQTGRGMAASIMAAGMGVQRTMGAAVGAVRGTMHAAKSVQKAGHKASEKFQDYKSKHNPPSYNADGTMAASSINARAQGQGAHGKHNAAYQGQALGASVVAGASGIPPAFAEKLNTSSAKQDNNGTISMDTFPDADGKKTRLTAAPLSGPNATQVHPADVQGRVLDLDGQKYLAVASGAGANDFLTKNPAMEEKMKSFEDSGRGSAKQFTDAAGNGTGVWQTTTTDKDGKITEAKQYAPANMYQADQAMGSQVATIGDMQYHVSDVTAAESGARSMEKPILAGMSPKDASETLTGQFPAFAGNDFSVTDVAASTESMGVIGFKNSQDGQSYAVAPTAAYDIASGVTGAAQIVTATNGAQFVAIPVPPDGTAESQFVARNSDSAIYARTLPTVDNLGAQRMHNLFNAQSNDIGETAQAVNHKKNKH